MNFFARIIKHYITYTLGMFGGLVDSDTHAELDEAFAALDNHIKKHIAAQIELHEQAKHADGAE